MERAGRGKTIGGGTEMEGEEVRRKKEWGEEKGWMSGDKGWDAGEMERVRKRDVGGGS